MRLVGLWQQFQQARLAVKRLGDLMDVPAEPYRLRPVRAAQRAASGQSLIAIDHLAFRHADDRPFLYEDLNVEISAGECVAIHGPSGCGKSTLARLLQGFHLPTRGTIRIDGVDTRHLSANELRSTFGVVPQETVLFCGTLLENLQLANPAATVDEIVSACRMAEIHDVIEQLPKGYETEIGERGAGLSGGQRQRLSIARALLKRPRVLLFDEATSNLDQDAADGIVATINELRGKATIIVISHAPLRGLRIDRVVDLVAGDGRQASLKART
jgi:subfamily B ATP-binding cassette protein HlyB/CyaB